MVGADDDLAGAARERWANGKCVGQIDEAATNPVTVQLPFDGDPMRTVTVRATDFSGIVAIEVVLIPDSGDRIVFPAVIDMGLGNPSDVVVDIVVPLNTATRIHAWTQSVP